MADTRPVKRQARGEDEGSTGRASHGDPAAAPCCAICLQDAPSSPSSEWALLDEHGCSTCKKGAWSICRDCHAGRLSRECPICRSDYAPLILYPFPTAVLAGENVNPRKAATFQALSIAVLNSNTVVWTPSLRRGAVSLLPHSADFEAPFLAAPELPMPAGLFDGFGDEYHFTNSVWTALEAHSEAADDEEREVLGAAQGAAQPELGPVEPLPREVNIMGHLLALLTETELMAMPGAALEYDQGFVCDGCERVRLRRRTPSPRTPLPPAPHIAPGAAGVSFACVCVLLSEPRRCTTLAAISLFTTRVGWTVTGSICAHSALPTSRQQNTACRHGLRRKQRRWLVGRCARSRTQR